MQAYLGQIGRGLIVTGLWRILQPASDSPLWAYMDMVAVGIIGLSLLILYHLHSLINLFGR